MKPESRTRLPWGTAALPAAFLALSALCAPALAQTGPAGAPGTGCLPLAKANNTMTPPALYAGVAQCVAHGDYDAAARLFALAGIYLHFDVPRVSDRSAAGVAGALPMLATNGATPEQKDRLVQGIDALLNDPARLKSVCSEVARIGRPAYYPQYMLASGMGAFVGEPKGGPLAANFDAAATWAKLQASYLECPLGEAPAPQSPGLLSKFFGAHVNSNAVAEKIAEWADAGSGLIQFNPVFSPDGSVLVSFGNYDDAWKINVWDWRNRRLLRQMEVLGNPYLALEPLAFSPDGRFLALCTAGEEHYTAVRVWNAATWQVAADIVDLHSPGCSAVAFSADSRMLLRVNDLNVSSAPDDVLAYSTETWQKLWGLHDKRIDAQTLAVSPGGNLVAVGGIHYVVPPDRDPAKVKQEPEVALLDLQHGKYVKIISSATSIQSMSWSPDGTRLAVLEVPGFEIFDMPSGQRVVQQNLPYGAPTSIRYSPNGKYLVINSFIGPNGPKPGFGMQIWDGQASALLQTNSVDTAGIAFSPDSRFLAAAVRGRIEIWQFK